MEGENDSSEELEKNGAWIVENREPLFASFQRISPAYNFEPPRQKNPTLLRAYEIAKTSRAKYVYTGNILHVETSTTYCTHASNPIIKREGLKSQKLTLNSQNANSAEKNAQRF